MVQGRPFSSAPDPRRDLEPGRDLDPDLDLGLDIVVVLQVLGYLEVYGSEKNVMAVSFHLIILITLSEIFGLPCFCRLLLAYQIKKNLPKVN